MNKTELELATTEDIFEELKRRIEHGCQGSFVFFTDYKAVGNLNTYESLAAATALIEAQRLPLPATRERLRKIVHDLKQLLGVA